MARIKPNTGLTFAWMILAGSMASANPALPTIPTNVYNILNYGAMANGSKDNRTNIQNAINAASTAGGGLVEIPAGTFLSGPIVLPSSIDLQVDSNAVLQMVPITTWTNQYASSNQFIYCKNVHDLALSGPGVIDGQGSGWWNSSVSSSSRPLIAQLYSATRLFIHDITIQNSPYHHCGIRDNGGDITISNVTESAPSTSPNTDGFDFVGTNCLIQNCNISVGDDNIALGSTGPLIDLVISNCAFGSGHGVSIGSSVSQGISNLTVANCSFNGTVNGIRMKSPQDGSAPCTNLNYCNITMTNVGLPIVIWTYYNITETPTSVSTAEVLSTTPSNINSTTPRWDGILISNLNIVSGASSQIGGIIWGPTEWPISNVTLVNITNNAPNTFELYNVYGLQIINSQFNFSSGNTFTLCDAGATFSNTTANSAATLTGAGNTNLLAVYNSSMSGSSTNLFAANPIGVGGCVLTDTTSLTLPATTTQNFLLGANASTIAVTGNLTLNSTVNIAPAAGFAPATYTLFTYTGGFSGHPVLGATPAGFPGYTFSLSTNTPGRVLFVSTPPTPPTFSTAALTSGGGGNGGMVLSGSGGVTNGIYYLLESTNVSLPLNRWTVIATNQFDAAGHFILTNAISNGVSQEFYLLREP